LGLIWSQFIHFIMITELVFVSPVQGLRPKVKVLESTLCVYC
jgi:hypothetical protein